MRDPVRPIDSITTVSEYWITRAFAGDDGEGCVARQSGFTAVTPHCLRNAPALAAEKL
jgi:hypothetical protein